MRATPIEATIALRIAIFPSLLAGRAAAAKVAASLHTLGVRPGALGSKLNQGIQFIICL